MKRNYLLLGLLTLALITAPKAQDTKQRIDTPVFKVGDEWRYRKQEVGGPEKTSEFSERMPSCVLA